MKSTLHQRKPLLKKLTTLIAFLLSVSFTINAQVSKNYQHWSDIAPGAWQGDILSAQKSDYFEGEVIPHVLVIQATNQKPLTNGAQPVICEFPWNLMRTAPSCLHALLSW